MKVLLQRVEGAAVEIENKIVGQIKDKGLLIFLGISTEDTEDDINYLVRKILNLRIFDDNEGRMNLSVMAIDGEILVVSQFTLYAECKKGNRPSYDKAARPEKAKELYDNFISEISKSGLKMENGVFGANMKVKFTNSGPVTIMLESK